MGAAIDGAEPALQDGLVEHRAIVGMGSNLGSREAMLRAAERLLRADPDVSVRGRSRLYRTEPVGPPQPRYLNAALALTTALRPEELLERLLEIERRLGRVRHERWGPRTLDLDLLHWSAGRVRTADLIVPHPRLEERAFALAPLLDVAPELAGRLEAALRAVGGAPESRPWSTPRWSRPRPGTGGAARRVAVEALDAEDALALAIGAAIDGPATGEVAPVEAAGLEALGVDVGRRSPMVVALAVESTSAEGVRGRALLGRRPPVALRSVRLRGAACTVEL